ncbi:MAG: hypothetical protein M1815_000203 [Lichina confinis]|nr:MAG: hypothetical protein M1815_000203 [Lichina confinis]
MAVDEPIAPAVDDRPIALRRNRRLSKVVVMKEKSSDVEIPRRNFHRRARQEEDTTATSTAVTPRKKRVRFSEPGLGTGPTTSTGLTPALRRHRLVGSPSKPVRFPGRRQSLPAKLISPLTESASTLQFAPLRQVIDGRSRRRLKRNHLSEETNAIEKEKRLEEQLRREDITSLREQVQERDHWVKQLMQRLKDAQNMNVQSAVVPDPESSFGSSGMRLREEDCPEEPLEDRQTDKNGAANVHNPNDYRPAESNAGSEGDKPSHADEASSSRGTTPDCSTASAGAQVDTEEPSREGPQVEALRNALAQVTSELEMTRSTHLRISAKLQGHLQDSSASLDSDPDLDTALNMVVTSLVLAQTRAEDAEASLNAVSSDVAELGFAGRNAEEMLIAIKRQFRQARLELEHLQPGENTIGFDNEKLLGMLIERVQALLCRIRDGAKEHESQRQVNTVLQRRLDEVDAQAKSAEAKVEELTTDVDEKDRSIKKLQRALEGYQAEVRSLESLVDRLEEDHAKQTERMQRGMDEAVADLEVKLEAEMKGKEEAMSEAHEEKRMAEDLQARVEKAKGIIERMNREKDTLSAAKDVIISHLEAEADERDRAIVGYESQLDIVDHEKLLLASSLNEAQASIGSLTNDKTVLEARLAVELEEGMRVMEAMQSELMRSLARAGEMKNKHAARSRDESASVSLPPTPCSLRFATPKKRKRRVDSGIGVLEEEDEEMLDA